MLPTMRIGVLTGGGDCPGLNAVIRAVVTQGINGYGHEFVGFRDGWKGPLEGLTRPLGLADVADILPRGGTILGSSRTNPVQDRGRARPHPRRTSRALGVDALIAIGGEDTLGVAKRLTDDGLGVVGVPKTIDNDLDATDYTFGFDTAICIATEAIDRLRTTAESHHRALVVEVMGRHAGWIALHSGMAGGANVILVPERPFDIDAGRRAGCQHRFERDVRPDHRASAEGALPLGGGASLMTEARSTRSATCAWAASASGWPRRSSGAPGTRPARSCSATCSAAARPRRTTGCCPPASACTRSTRSTRRTSG